MFTDSTHSVVKNLEAWHAEVCVGVCAKSFQSCQTLCNSVDCSLPGFSVHGILQTRTLEWVAMPSSRDLPDPGIKPASLMSPELARRVLYHNTTYTTLGEKDMAFSTWYDTVGSGEGVQS